MADPLFQLNPGESILFRSQPSRKWYALVWKIGVGFFEVIVFIFFSFTAFTSITANLLARLLSPDIAVTLSQILFQGILPILVTAWFVEDTARIFTSEFVLTNQRIWTKGSPYAWISARETLLSDVKSITSRSEAVFIHLKSTKKVQVDMVPDGKLVIKAFEQLKKEEGID
jgi:hypothetical protein